MGGSYGTQKYGIKGGYKCGGLRTFAASSYESTDGNRRGMGYWLANQYASVSYDFSGHWEAGANVMLTETKADNPGYGGISADRETGATALGLRYDVPR